MYWNQKVSLMSISSIVFNYIVTHQTKETTSLE